MHKRFDALLLAVGGGAFGFWLLSGTSVFSSENSSLIVYNGQLDFGEAWAAGDFQWQIRYKNVTNEEIKIERFSISCNCVQCASENLSIPPKADGSLRVKLNLNRAFSGTASGAFQSPFIRGVDANGEGKGFKRKPWKITGQVHRAFIFQSQPLLLADSFTRGQPFRGHNRRWSNWRKASPTTTSPVCVTPVLRPSALRLAKQRTMSL